MRSFALTLELDANGFEFLPKFAGVMDLAAEDNPVAGARILHGLVPKRREIDDGQSPVTQADLNRLRLEFFQQHGAGIIGSPVREQTGGLFQNCRRDLGFTRQDANDAARLKYFLASLLTETIWRYVFSIALSRRRLLTQIGLTSPEYMNLYSGSE